MVVVDNRVDSGFAEHVGGLGELWLVVDGVDPEVVDVASGESGDLKSHERDLFDERMLRTMYSAIPTRTGAVWRWIMTRTSMRWSQAASASVVMSTSPETVAFLREVAAKIADGNNMFPSEDDINRLKFHQRGGFLDIAPVNVIQERDPIGYSVIRILPKGKHAIDSQPGATPIR